MALLSSLQLSMFKKARTANHIIVKFDIVRSPKIFQYISILVKIQQ
jgi:hypothetical protein